LFATRIRTKRMPQTSNSKCLKTHGLGAGIPAAFLQKWQLLQR
jgi:hypothetical protein